MSGLTAEGFLGKRLPEIKAELEAEFTAQFGSELNFSSESIIGQLIGIESEARSTIWAELEDVYQSQYPSTASGNALDLLVALNGITRLADLPTTVTGYLTLSSGTTVTAGSKAKDDTVTYSLNDDVSCNVSATYGGTVAVSTVADSTDYTINIGGTAYTYTSGASATAGTILAGLQALLPVSVSIMLGDASMTLEYDGPVALIVSDNMSISNVINTGEFQCDTTGPVSLPIGALDEIETPIAGWTAINNRAEGTIGRDIETDGALRVRRDASVRLAAVSTVDGIIAALLQTDDVVNAVVIENSGTVNDADGVPPQHIWCIVEGGESDDIVDVIFRRKTAGIGTFGDVTDIAYSATTEQPFEIKFSRPTSTPVYITVNIEGSTNLPTDYISLVRAALVEHGDGLGIGDNLILNRLYTPSSLAIDGASYVTSITLGVTASPTATDNLLADTDERFQIISENINVLLD